MTTTLEHLSPKTGKPIPVSRGSYVNHRCRCDGCTAANREAVRKAWTPERRTLLGLKCSECGADFQARRGQTTCSARCRALARTMKGPALPSRTYICDLVEAGLWGLVKVRLLKKTVQVGDCLEWDAGEVRRDYPTITLRDKDVPLHRLMLQAKHHGRPLGVLQSHHVCANPRCINPDHLQPVTAAENVAEMRARRSYLARIQELEDALREVAPDHEILNRISHTGEMT